MDAKEALAVLLRWAIDDRREVNAVIARSWADRFWDIPARIILDAGERVLDQGGYIDPRSIKRELAIMRPAWESEVRSAKLRGLVSNDYPKSQPLPDAVAAQLHELRLREFEATNDYPDEIEAGGRDIGLGEIGRKP